MLQHMNLKYSNKYMNDCLKQNSDITHFRVCVLKIFQSFVEQSIFVVQMSLLYEKVSIFDGEYDAIKIK